MHMCVVAAVLLWCPCVVVHCRLDRRLAQRRDAATQCLQADAKYARAMQAALAFK